MPSAFKETCPLTKHHLGLHGDVPLRCLRPFTLNRRPTVVTSITTQPKGLWEYPKWDVSVRSWLYAGRVSDKAVLQDLNHGHSIMADCGLAIADILPD